VTLVAGPRLETAATLAKSTFVDSGGLRMCAG